MGDTAKVIHWNGTDLPAELASVPPGRYRLESVDGANDEQDEVLVSSDTEARILAGRADVAAERTVPWSEVDAGLGHIIAVHSRG